MKKFGFILAILLSLPLVTLSQEVDQDALFAVYQDSTLNAEKRLSSLRDLVNSLREPPSIEQMDRWYEAMDVAITLSEESNNKKYISTYLSFKATYQIYRLGDTELSCTTGVEALDMALEYDDYYSTYYMTASLLYQEMCPNNERYTRDVLEDILDSTEKKIIKNEKSSELKDLLLLTHYSRGSYYESISDYPKALKHLQKAESLSRDLQQSDYDLGWTLKLLGYIHMEIGNYIEAEKYFVEGLDIMSQVNSLPGQGAINNDLSMLYLYTNQPDKALEAAENAIAIMEPAMQTDAACKMCVHESYTAEAGVYNLLGDYDTALEKLLKMKAYHDDPNSGAGSYGYAFYFTQLGTAYLGLRQYEKAIEAANRSLSYATGNTLNETRRSHEIIYQSQRELQNFSKAFEGFENFVKIKDSMAVLRNAQEVTRLALENTFQQEQLKNDLAFQDSLNKEKAKRNQTIAISIFAGLIALFLFYRLKLVQKTRNLLKQKNAQIEAEKDKAKASEKAKHQFLANMSHEIRTPMNAIKGMTDILIRRNPKKDQKEYLDGIKQSSDSLLVIINDILDISKIEAGKIELENEEFSIIDVVSNVHTIMQFKAEEKGLQLESNFSNESLRVNGDASRLRQILINLIGNAIKFTEKGMVTTSVKSNNGVIQFTVSDTGIGIDDDRLDKIFKSFEQAYADTSRKFGGTGLGLSISKKMVELQEGKMWVESEKGKGSQFHFAIPYTIVENTDTTQSETQEESDSNNAQRLKGVRILLVEDNEFNAVVAQEELEDAIENVSIEVAQNGVIALEKLQYNDIDVILMDIQMPVMNGFEATEKIRASNNEKSNTPIIAMTANVLKEEVDHCYKVGMNDFIGKPFDTEDLVNKIHNLVKA